MSREYKIFSYREYYGQEPPSSPHNELSCALVQIDPYWPAEDLEQLKTKTSEFAHFDSADSNTDHMPPLVLALFIVEKSNLDNFENVVKHGYQKETPKVSNTIEEPGF